MAVAITDFLQASALLCQDALHIPNDHAASNIADELLLRITADFEALAARLVHRDTSGLLQNQVFATQQLARACRKVCLDITLRLKRTAANENDHTTVHRQVSFGVTWTRPDVDALITRILDLSSKWKDINAFDNGEIAVMLSKAHKQLDLLCAEQNVGKTGLSAITKDVAAPTKTVALAGPLVDFILESLSFKSMKNREEEVADAHANTFDWVFKYDSGDGGRNSLGDQFTSWLQNDKLGSIYWVTGKPGSGKSTLMRYIADHKSTDDLLKQWTNGRPVAKAVFYFWTSGSEEQRSQTGLLRYLLHQLLSCDLDATPKVFPELWQKLSDMTTKERIRFDIDWSVAELMDGFHNFVQYALQTMNICLFVDGLDEFDGDHEVIIQFFKNLVEQNKTGCIKLCLSSRPWPVFQQAFQYSVPNLKLQDLTSNDMEEYVTNHLIRSPKMMGTLSEENGQAKRLIQKIVLRAEGVFLWVRLVVRKILETYASPANLDEMEKFVIELPSDLDELFNLFLFHSQPQGCLQESAHIFRLVRAREDVASFVRNDSANSLSIWDLAWAISATDVNNMSDTEPCELSDIRILELSKTTLGKVMSASTGLLEVYTKRERGNMFQSRLPEKGQPIGAIARKLARSRVTYLHRTVRDYLATDSDVWNELISNSSDIFDPHVQLIRSHILRLKHSIEPIEHHRRLDEWYPDIALSLTHARYIGNAIEGLEISLINMLDSTISWYWQSRPGDVHDHWARSCFGTYEARKGNKIIFAQPFLALCSKFGLQHYVLETLNTLANTNEKTAVESPTKADLSDMSDVDSASKMVEETPLLAYALEFLTSRQKTIMPYSSPTFVSRLLNSPHQDHPVLGKLIGKPNLSFNSPVKKMKGVTPWISVLRHLRDAQRRGWIAPFDNSQDGTMRWTQIVRILARDGKADLNAFLEWNGFDEECYARDVLMGPKQLGAIDDWWIHSLKDIFIEDISYFSTEER